MKLKLIILILWEWKSHTKIVEYAWSSSNKKKMKWSLKWSLLNTMRLELWECNSKSQIVLFCAFT